MLEKQQKNGVGNEWHCRVAYEFGGKMPHYGPRDK